MSHEFESQTEEQTRLYVPPNGTAPSVATPEIPSEMEARPTPELKSVQEETLVPAAGETWQILMQRWQQESRKDLLYKLPGLSIGIMALSLPVYFLLLAPSFPVDSLYMLLLLPWMGFWALMFGMGIRRQNRLTSGQKAILYAMATVEDTAAIGPILETWRTAVVNGQGRAELSKVLIRLLPKLRRENGVNLTMPQRRILYNCIGHASSLHHPELTLACLDAIEQIGDTHALPPLARLVAHDAPSQQEQRVRERAQQCLAHLTHALDFGTTADIPRWISKLPYTSSSVNNAPTLPAGADEALIALFALIQLLPQLQPSDAGLLKASQREYLAESWRWMMFPLYGNPIGNVSVQQSRLGSAFPFAVLDALEQIGTGRDVNLSQWLLTDVPLEDLPQLRLRARAVNAILEQRREKERAGQTLLRASDAPPAAPGELLRPATSQPLSSDPKELLRPEREKRRDR